MADELNVTRRGLAALLGGGMLALLLPVEAEARRRRAARVAPAQVAPAPANTNQNIRAGTRASARSSARPCPPAGRRRGPRCYGGTPTDGNGI